MWRSAAVSLAILLSLVPREALADVCDASQVRGLAWDLRGPWQQASRPVEFMDPVDIRQIRPASSRSSRIMVVLNGAFLTRICGPDGTCNDECGSAKASRQIPGGRFETAIREAERPKYRTAMSR